MFEDVKGQKTLNVTLTNLRKYVSYAIQILAYTRMGDGKLSSQVIRKTDEDGETLCPSCVHLLAGFQSYQELFKGLLHWKQKSICFLKTLSPIMCFMALLQCMFVADCTLCISVTIWYNILILILSLFFCRSAWSTNHHLLPQRDVHLGHRCVELSKWAERNHHWLQSFLPQAGPDHTRPRERVGSQCVSVLGGHLGARNLLHLLSDSQDQAGMGWNS